MFRPCFMHCLYRCVEANLRYRVVIYSTASRASYSREQHAQGGVGSKQDHNSGNADRQMLQASQLLSILLQLLAALCGWVPLSCFTGSANGSTAKCWSTLLARHMQVTRSVPAESAALHPHTNAGCANLLQLGADTHILRTMTPV